MSCPETQMLKSPDTSPGCFKHTDAAVGQHPDPFSHIADDFRQIRAGKTHAKLVDPNQLPRRQAAVRKVDDMFWRQSTSAYAQPAAAKKRRKQTLGKGPRKAARVARPGRYASPSRQPNPADVVERSGLFKSAFYCLFCVSH